VSPPQERREPQTVAPRGGNDRRDDGRRADGRRDDDRRIDGAGRYATPRTGPVPRYRDGDRRVYVQPRPNYYVYRYPSYRYAYPSRYYGYRYYDPYFRDDFDGRLQGLRLESGNYSGEVGLPGYVPLQFDVHVQPGRTTTYRGSLIPEP
jgi:hypothetical protein